MSKDEIEKNRRKIKKKFKLAITFNNSFIRSFIHPTEFEVSLYIPNAVDIRSTTYRTMEEALPECSRCGKGDR